ncbi:testis-expressed protein 9 [Genypterus blacodes]|uniref:testis-expressed protein 9 n=1 Tax=Genypterus blacodes TaxID=154954 RepID=UPI003F76149F
MQPEPRLLLLTMADRSSIKKSPSVVFETKKRPSSRMSSRGQRSEVSPAAPAQQQLEDLLTQEKQYMLINAELEAKTADLVRQAEHFMREQYGLKPTSPRLFTDTEEEEESEVRTSHSSTVVQDPPVKGPAKKSSTSKTLNSAGKQRRVKWSTAEDAAAADGLAEAQSVTEKKLLQPDCSVDHHGDTRGGPSDVPIRVLNAEVRVMQEEMEQLSYECYKKDDEISKLNRAVKDLEEDRARLQKNTNVQQTQISKHKDSAEESTKKSSVLQLQVAALRKEIENLNRTHKKAAGVHSAAEIRLNRAQEEVERLKGQLSSLKQTNQDKINQEHQSKENLLAENKMLKKQKAELLVGFKKQLRLIDVLKRQKMHFEAAKLLSFTEEEFLKALDWGKA